MLGPYANPAKKVTRQNHCAGIALGVGHNHVYLPILDR